MDGWVASIYVHMNTQIPNVHVCYNCQQFSAMGPSVNNWTQEKSLAKHAQNIYIILYIMYVCGCVHACVRAWVRVCVCV